MFNLENGVSFLPSSWLVKNANKNQQKTLSNRQIEKRPKLSCDFLFSSDNRRRSESASIVLRPVLLCDQIDLIFPKTNVPPFTTAPPNLCNLFSLFEACFTLTSCAEDDADGSNASSEFDDEFIDDDVKFLWKKAFEDV